MKNLTRNEIDQKLVEYKALELLVVASQFPEDSFEVSQSSEPEIKLLKNLDLVEADSKLWLLTPNGKQKGEEITKHVHNKINEDAFWLANKISKEIEELSEADLASPQVDGLVEIMKR